MERLPAELGKFRIECELGRGGMGVVYRAFDPVVERSVAIKAIRCSDESGGQSLERLRREAKAVGSLEHSNIVTLFDAVDTGGTFYLVMQLVEGETLRERMDRQRKFQPREILDILRQLLAALEYAHARGVVHRDVKPANVLITADGTLKLADFGVARLAGPAISTKGLVVGTPSYMSPEQILGMPVDGRSDIFAAGCILYELTIGRKAFTGSSTTAVMYQIVHEAPPMPSLVIPGIRPAIEAAIMRALAKDPAERFGLCAEFWCALEACLAEEPPPPVETRKEYAVSQRWIAARAAWRLPMPKRSAAVAVGMLVALAVLSMSLGVAPTRDHAPAERIERPQTRSGPEPQEVPQPGIVPAVRRQPPPEVRRRPTLATVPKSAPDPSVSPAEPTSFSSLMVKGDLAFQREQYAEALDFYQRALLVKPANRTIRSKVATARSVLGQREKR